MIAWNATVYGISLVLLGVAIPKAAAIAALATISAVVGYGTRWIYRFGFTIMILGVLVSLNFLPPATGWRSLLTQMIGPLAAK